MHIFSSVTGAAVGAAVVGAAVVGAAVVGAAVVAGLDCWTPPPLISWGLSASVMSMLKIAKAFWYPAIESATVEASQLGA